MRILMLGWEFPPFVAGGLGVACYGLTKALDRLGHEVVFILPKPVDRSHASHVRMLSPMSIAARLAAGGSGSSGGGGVALAPTAPTSSTNPASRSWASSTPPSAA